MSILQENIGCRFKNMQKNNLPCRPFFRPAGLYYRREGENVFYQTGIMPTMTAKIRQRIPGSDFRRRQRKNPPGADALWRAAGGEFPVATGVFWTGLVSGGVFYFDPVMGTDPADDAGLFRDRRSGGESAATVSFMGHLCRLFEFWRIFTKLGLPKK